MDTKQLLINAKARFSHLTAKAQLKDKYMSKLLIADQGGLWLATPELIAFLSSGDPSGDPTIVIVDTFNNPVKVYREALLNRLSAEYKEVMGHWHTEWTSLEKKR